MNISIQLIYGLMYVSVHVLIYGLWVLF